MAYCKNCGAYIPDGQNVCLACGYDENAEKQKSTGSGAASAQAEETAHQIGDEAGDEEGHALLGVIHGKLVILPEKVGQDKENADIGQAGQHLRCIIAGNRAPDSAVNVTSRPAGGTRKISRLFLLCLLALGALRLRPFAAVLLLAAALLLQLLAEKVAVNLFVFFLTAF